MSAFIYKINLSDVWMSMRAFIYKSMRLNLSIYTLIQERCLSEYVCLSELFLWKHSICIFATSMKNIFVNVLVYLCVSPVKISSYVLCISLSLSSVSSNLLNWSIFSNPLFNYNVLGLGRIPISCDFQHPIIILKTVVILR